VTVAGPTQTIPGPTQTITQTVVPDACAKALAAAETVMADDNKGWTVASSAFRDLRNADFVSAGADNRQLNDIATRKQADYVTYQSFAAQCASGK
jgi:hypothetical protein